MDRETLLQHRKGITNWLESQPSLIRARADLVKWNRARYVLAILLFGSLICGLSFLVYAAPPTSNPIPLIISIVVFVVGLKLTSIVLKRMLAVLEEVFPIYDQSVLHGNLCATPTDYTIIEKTSGLFKLRVFHPKFSRFALIIGVVFLVLSIINIIVVMLKNNNFLIAVLDASLPLFASGISFCAFFISGYDSVVLINRQERIVQRDIYFRILRMTSRRSVEFSSITRVFFATDARSTTCTLKLETTSSRRTVGLFDPLPLPEFRQWEAYFRELFQGIPFTVAGFPAGYEPWAL